MFNTTVEGSATTKNRRAVTLRTSVIPQGLYNLTAIRTSDTDLQFDGTVVDEIQWEDLYILKEIEQEFGNITTIQTKTRATGGALSVKERKLNLIVTRKVPQWNPDTRDFSENLPTTRADHIFTAICRDEKIGNRPLDEIDLDNIYDTIKEIEEYFGTENAVQFSYTFDADNLSFEETAQSVARAVFCVAYRQGSQIRLKFEKADNEPELLFNHRNKIPRSETRTYRLGNENNYDGVELEYVDPVDDAILTLFLPDDQSATNAEEIETIGIRNKQQALLHAHREFNKIKHQSSLVEFRATQEAEILVQNSIVMVADNTTQKTYDGQIVTQENLILELSQPFEQTTGNYVIFLQHIDGTVENIPITKDICRAPADRKSTRLNSSH